MPKNLSETPRDRLLETARTLFLTNGVPNTGINTVTAQADVARMTLYNNFASKDALVQAVFESEAERRRETIALAQEASEDPIERVLALFGVALELASQKGFRGCAFINLVVESAAPDSALHKLAKQHKVWIFKNLRDQLCEGAFADPDTLARQICILWDGGIVGAFMQQS
ncbi:unnamed protein product, partial [Ectocarpus sp. 12 AP-2014]